MRVQHVCSVAFAGLVMLTMMAADATEDLLRQGNAAFGREDYEQALHLYTQAEQRSPDPGQVAFNKAAAYYRLGNYAEAELHYRLCGHDATGLRQGKTLYGLANCLLQRGQDHDAEALREAIRYYEQCLAHEETSATLIADARHNLELAKLLLLQIRTSRQQSNPEKPNQSDPRPPTQEQRSGSKHDNGERFPGTAGAKIERSGVKGKPDQQRLDSDQPPGPGAKTLPAIPDRAELVSLPPDVAAAHLERAAARILEEARAHRRGVVKAPASGVRDW